MGAPERVRRGGELASVSIPTRRDRLLRGEDRGNTFLPEENQMSDELRNEHDHRPNVRREGAQSADERVDEASEESFPASDPPSYDPSHAGTPKKHANGARE